MIQNKQNSFFAETFVSVDDHNFDDLFSKINTPFILGHTDMTEEDYLNDDSELSEADFLATGESLDDEDEDIDPDDEEEEVDNDITEEELQDLDVAGNEQDNDDQNLADGQLDSLDGDGDKLNENDDLDGEDLDVPGSDLDDEEELIGNEDEENNSYSKDKQED